MEAPVLRFAAAMATAIARPAGMVASAIRSTFRPPPTKASSTLATGTKIESTSRKPAASSRLDFSRPQHHSSTEFGIGARKRAGVQRCRPCRFKEPQQERNRQRRRPPPQRQSRDDKRLRYGIAAQRRNRSPACDNAEKQKHTAAQEIESENFPKRLRIDDHAIEAETCRRRRRTGRIQLRWSWRAFPFRRPRDQKAERHRDR